MANIINVNDKFLEAVEEFNRTFTDPSRKDRLSKISPSEKQGIFYNCLRRQFSGYNSISNFVRARSISLVFRENGELRRVRLGNYLNYIFNGWGNNEDIFHYLIEVSNSYEVLYPTKELNELASIIKKI